MVLSVPAVEPKRYYSVQLIDGNTFNYGYIGSRATGNDAGDYMVVGPEWKGDNSRRDQEGVPVGHAVLARPLSHPASSIRATCDNVTKVQAGYKAQPLSAYLKQPAPPASPTIDFPKIDKELVKTNFFEYLDFCLQFAPAPPEREGDPREARAHRHRARKTFSFKDLSLEHKAEILSA